MPDLDLLAMIALAALLAVMLRRGTRAKVQTGREELARLRMISDRKHREEAMPFDQ